MNVAYNMDCLEAMRQMPDKAFGNAFNDGNSVVIYNTRLGAYT